MLSVKPKFQNAGIANFSAQPIKERIESGKVNFARSFAVDNILFSPKNYSIETKGKVTKIVSFAGKPKVHTHSLRTPLIEVKRHRDNCNKLAGSTWSEGIKLNLERRKDSLIISHPKCGVLGKLNHSLAREMTRLIECGYELEASLVDIEGEGSKDHPYKPEVKIGYKLPEGSKVSDIPLEVIKTFSNFLKDPENKNIVRYCQPALAPSECLELLVPFDTVQSVMNEIDKAKNILLIGHKFSDGDTVGCLLALRSALNKLDKSVECSIDDKPDGLLRHKLPGIDEYLKTPATLPADKKYDLVMILDTSSTKLIGNHKKHLKSADKVIFIDHHELNRKSWREDGKKVGVNLEKVIKDNLLWVKKELPAASQMVAALIFKMLPANVLESMTIQEKQGIAKPLVAGIATDTVFFSKKGAGNAEGLSKFLMNWGDFSRKWVRDTIRYDLPLPAKEKLESYISKGTTIDKDNNFASIQVPYEALMDVFNTAKKYDSDVTKIDVINQFKYNSAFEDIRFDNQTGEKTRVAAYLIQSLSKKSGDDKDEIIVSLRSPENSYIACRIAKIFKGGGHLNAAATRIYGHNLHEKCYTDFNSKYKRLTLERKIAKLSNSLQIFEERKRKKI